MIELESETKITCFFPFFVLPQYYFFSSQPALVKEAVQ